MNTLENRTESVRPNNPRPTVDVPIGGAIDEQWPDLPSAAEVIEFLSGRSRERPSVQGNFEFLASVDCKVTGNRRRAPKATLES